MSVPLGLIPVRNLALTITGHSPAPVELGTEWPQMAPPVWVGTDSSTCMGSTEGSTCIRRVLNLVLNLLVTSCKSKN